MPLDDTNDAVPPAEHPHVESTPRAHARPAEPHQTSTVTGRATAGQYPVPGGIPVLDHADTLPEPGQAIHALLVDLVRRADRKGRRPEATSLAVVPTVDDGPRRRTLVQIAIPLNDNHGVPFPKSVLQPIFDEIYDSHRGATVRPAFGVCPATRGVDVDSLADVELWTTAPDRLVEQVGRWREALDQREIVVRIFDRVTFLSIVRPGETEGASNDNGLVGEAS